MLVLAKLLEVLASYQPDSLVRVNGSLLVTLPDRTIEIHVVDGEIVVDRL